MKIITRYILREASLYFLLCLGIFTVILLTVRMIRFTALIVNRGVELQQIAAVFLSITPSFLELAVPLATLLGIMMALGRLSGDSEIVVLRASGISLVQLLSPILTFGAVAALLCALIGTQLSPRGIHSLSETLFDIAKSRSTAGLDAGVFNKLGNMILYADEIQHDNGSLRHVLVDDKRNKEQRKVVIAQSGTIESDRSAQTITIRLYDGAIHEMLDGKYVLTRFQTNSLVLASDEILDPDAQERGRSAREMFVPEIQTEIDRMLELLFQIRQAPEGDLELRKQIASTFGLPTLYEKKDIKRRLRKFEVEKERRLAMPVAALVLAFLALSLGIYPPRSQRLFGPGLAVFFGLLVFTFYYAFLSIGIALAETGRVPAVIGLWIPNLATFVLALWLFYKMAREHWQSTVHGLERAIEKLRTLRAIRGGT